MGRKQVRSVLCACDELFRDWIAKALYRYPVLVRSWSSRLSLIDGERCGSGTFHLRSVAC
jgi:hypothetical protein